MGRRIAVLSLLIALPACTDGGCGDVLGPLTQPIPPAAFFENAAAVRVSSAGVSFIEENLPEIVSAVASSSCDDVPCPNNWGTCDAENVCRSTDPTSAFIGIKVPPTVVDDPGAYFEELRVCTSHRSPTFDDCNVYVDVTDVDLQPNANNTLGVTADVTIWSSWIKMHLHGAGIIEPDFNCDVRIRNANNQAQPIYKTVGASLSFDASNPLGRLELTPSPLSIDLVENDVVLCGILEWDIIKGLIFGFIEDAVKDAIQGAVDDMLTSLVKEDCVEGPCSRPDLSFCNAGQMCQFNSGGELVPALLGLEGSLALDTLLGGFAGESSTVAISAAANSATTPSGGISMAMRAATDAPSSTCVPSLPAPNPTLPTYAPTGSGWHVAVGASDKLLNRIVFDAFDSGALCQTMEPGAIAQLSSGALSLLVPSLDEITGGSVPLALDIRPRAAPTVEIGRNITGPDPDNAGSTILIEPLINLYVEDLDLDVYASIDGALLRVLTLQADLNIDLSLAVGGSGELVLVAGDASRWISNVDVLHSDVLRESPADIEDAIPTLLGLVLPLLTESLAQTFEIPSFSGFGLSVGGVGGSQSFGTTTVGDFSRFAHLSIDANLSFDPSAARVDRIETEANIASLVVPDAHGLRNGERVEVLIDAGIRNRTDALTPVLWVKVDDGMWRVPHVGHNVVVTDPVLHREGDHTILVAAALPDVPLSQDATPEVLQFVVDAHPPELTLIESEGQVVVVASDSLANASELFVNVIVDGTVWGQLFLDANGEGLVDADPAHHEVRVSVADPSGRVTEAKLGVRHVDDGSSAPSAGVVADALIARTDDLEKSEAGFGCHATDASSSASVLVVLIGLVIVRRRRRA